MFDLWVTGILIVGLLYGYAKDMSPFLRAAECDRPKWIIFAVPSERSNEPSGPIKGGKFHD
jgi:hypothetical protein